MYRAFLFIFDCETSFYISYGNLFLSFLFQNTVCVSEKVSVCVGVSKVCEKLRVVLTPSILSFVPCPYFECKKGQRMVDL